MKNILCSAVLIFALAFARSSGAEANIDKLTSLHPTEHPTEHPIDTIQEQLFKTHNSKGAQTLKKSYEAFRAQNYKLASKFAKKLEKDKLYLDYGYWIDGSVSAAEALHAFQNKKPKIATQQAKLAISMFLENEIQSPYSPLLKSLPKDVARLEVLLGDVFWFQHKYPMAADHYERAFQRLSASNSLGILRPESIEHYSETCIKKEGPLCQSWLSKFLNFYPRTSEEAKAVFKFYPDLFDRAHFSGGFAKGTQSYHAPDLDQVAFDAAMSFFLDDRYKPSIAGFQKFLDEFPKSVHRYRARYWLAQAYTRDGDSATGLRILAELQKDAPLTYYGLLSSLETGTDIQTSIAGALPMAIDTQAYLQPQESLRLKRAEEMLVAGTPDLAAVELKDIRMRDALSNPFLVYLAMLNYEAKNFSTTFSILSELIQRGYDGVYTSYGLRLVFPTEYVDLIEKHSTANQLDPILVLSLIKQESAFDYSSVSGSGAIGLMQLMPATAVETVSTVNRSELTVPDTNIDVGSKYLKKLMTHYNGNIVLALAGYNAGPAAADRWIHQAPQKRGMIEFIETIPYKETRDYVSAIIRNYIWYSRRIKNDPPKALSYFWNIYGPPEIPTGLPKK